MCSESAQLAQQAEGQVRALLRPTPPRASGNEAASCAVASQTSSAIPIMLHKHVRTPLPTLVGRHGNSWPETQHNAPTMPKQTKGQARQGCGPRALGVRPVSSPSVLAQNSGCPTGAPRTRIPWRSGGMSEPCHTLAEVSETSAMRCRAARTRGSIPAAFHTCVFPPLI